MKKKLSSLFFKFANLLWSAGAYVLLFLSDVFGAGDEDKPTSQEKDRMPVRTKLYQIILNIFRYLLLAIYFVVNLIPSNTISRVYSGTIGRTRFAHRVKSFASKQAKRLPPGVTKKLGSIKSSIARSRSSRSGRVRSRGGRSGRR